MKKNITIILLVLIVSIGAILRLWQLGFVPPSPDWDEAALAYNAHSIAVTGRDEYGTFMPIILRSFGDYKPGLYTYLAIPAVETFGLTTFAIRLPSALFGILAIIAVYFLVKEIFLRKHSKGIALLAAFLLAVSPWHIQFSRVAFETNIGLTVNLLIALFFLKGLKKHWLMLPTALLAVLNLSVYQSERVFTPLLVLALIVIFRKEFFAIQKKYIFSAVLIGIIALLPVVIFISNNSNTLERFKGTSIFNNQEVLKKSVNRLAEDTANHDVIGIALENRRFTYAMSIVDGYISHYDPKWLFITGDDNNRHHAPNMGLIYIVFLPFIVFGIYKLIFGDFDKKTKYLIFAWFLLAPVPASVTTGVPHAVRTLNFIPTYEIFIALGLLSSVALLQRKYRFVAIVYMLLFSFNFVYFINQYFVQQNYTSAYDWQYGYEQAVPAVDQMKDGYDKILVSDKEPLDQSYIFFLFYLRYPPASYQKVVSNNKDGPRHFDKYEFRSFEWEKEIKNNNVLLVGAPKVFPQDVVTKKIIPYPNGEPAILIVDPKDNR